MGISALVLLAWIPMRERPGLGTISNALLVGPCADLGLDVLPQPHQLAGRVGFLLGGTVGIGTVGYAFSIGPLVQIFLRTDAIARPKAPLPAERNRGKS